MLPYPMMTLISLHCMNQSLQACILTSYLISFVTVSKFVQPYPFRRNFVSAARIGLRDLLRDLIFFFYRETSFQYNIVANWCRHCFKKFQYCISSCFMLYNSMYVWYYTDLQNYQSIADDRLIFMQFIIYFVAIFITYTTSQVVKMQP